MKLYSNIKDLILNPSAFFSYRLNEDWTRSLLYLIGISLFLCLILSVVSFLILYLFALGDPFFAPRDPYFLFSFPLSFLRLGLYNILLTLALAFSAHFIILSKKMDEITKSIQIFCYAQTPVLIAQFMLFMYYFLISFLAEIGSALGIGFIQDVFVVFVAFLSYFLIVFALLLLIGIILMISIINEGFKIVYNLHSSRYLIPIFILILIMTERFSGVSILTTIYGWVALTGLHF